MFNTFLLTQLPVSHDVLRAKEPISLSDEKSGLTPSSFFFFFEILTLTGEIAQALLLLPGFN